MDVETTIVVVRCSTNLVYNFFFINYLILYFLTESFFFLTYSKSFSETQDYNEKVILVTGEERYNNVVVEEC